MANWNDIEARRQAREEREQNAVQSLFNAIALQPTPEQEQHALSWISSFAFQTRQADHQEQEQDVRERLKRMGIEVSVAHYTGDSSYPTEYTLSYGDIRAVGPTLDLALLEFVERLLPKGQSQQSQQPRGFDAEDLSERAHEDWSNYE